MKPPFFLILFSLLLILSCTKNKNDIGEYKILFENNNVGNFNINENYTVCELFTVIMEKCNCDSIIKPYSGNYNICYDIVRQCFNFDTICDNSINIEILGFVCPASLLEISYYELKINYPSNISLEYVENHISSSTYKIDKQASLFNIIVPDEVRIYELSDYIKIIIEAYINVYKSYLQVSFGDNIINEDVILKSIKEFKEMTPLRIRITPQSFYN